MINVSKRLYDYLNAKASELTQTDPELEEELSFVISQLRPEAEN